MKKPNFFILGAPKCGTTALSEYLCGHPRVFFSNPKEPAYFDKDFASTCKINLNEYLSYFAKAGDAHKAVGEGSVLYLWSEVAVSNILSFQPDALFIVMLRNPVDLVYSYHSQLLYCLIENEPNFERAWRLRDARKQYKFIPKSCREPKLLFYDEVALLGRQMERLYEQVQKDRVKVVFYEDFVRNTKVTYETVLNHLELDPDKRMHFPVVNSNKTHKSDRIARLIISTANYWYIIKRSLRIRTRTGFMSWALKQNLVEKERDPMLPEFKEELMDFFRDDVTILSDITGRDLSHWLKS